MDSALFRDGTDGDFDGPLGGEYKKIPRSHIPYGYWDNVGNWLCMLKAWEDDSEKRKLLVTLTTAQTNSFRVLHEWWGHKRLDEGSIYRQWILTPDPGTSSVGHVDPPHLPWVEAPRRPRPNMPSSVYNTTLFELWWKEFAGYDSDIYTSSNPSQGRELAKLHRLRQNAVAVAATHRVADISYCNLLKWVKERSNKVPVTPKVEFLWDPMITACLEPCPWLGQSQDRKKWPFYLWDRIKSCTVSIEEVEGANKTPPYIAISHTWGRWWKYPDLAFVSGVPWLVPCVSLFEVERLPEILARVPGKTRYIWLDLVCIPQDNSLRKQKEIAKQAGIFTAAQRVVIWLNTIDKWDGLRAAIDWIGLQYLDENNAGGYETTKLQRIARKKAKSSTGLVFPYIRTREDNLFFPSLKSRYRNLEPLGWFTSLWTLQEACIRPDMWLCDKNWIAFSVDDRHPLCLEHLVALFNTSLPIWGKDRRNCPKGPHELSGIFTRTGLHKLLDMSRADVLNFGNQRYCKEYRAEAIMSVIGSTSWYEDQIATASSGNVLDTCSLEIEGRYPLDFVTETRLKLGAIFFSIVVFTRFSKKMYHLDSGMRISDTSIRATMMPFSSIVRTQQMFILDDKGIEDHPSVESWKIQEDGSVQMPMVGVVASWPSSGSGFIKATVKATPAGFYFSGEYELEQLLGSFRPNSEKHALCLLRQDDTMCYGILIERIYLGGQPSFMKVGNFWFTSELSPGYNSGCYTFPETKNVDWRVI